MADPTSLLGDSNNNVAPAVEAGLQRGIAPIAAVSAGLKPEPEPELTPAEREASPLAEIWAQQNPLMAYAAKGHWKELSGAEAAVASAQRQADLWQAIRDRGETSSSAIVQGARDKKLGHLRFLKHTTGSDRWDGAIAAEAYAQESRSMYDAAVTAQRGWFGRTAVAVARSLGGMAMAPPMTGWGALTSLGIASASQVGDNWHELSQITDVNGSPLDSGLVGTVAVLTGTAQAALDYASMTHGVTKYVPGASRLMGPGVVSKMFKSVSGQAMLTKFAEKHALAAAGLRFTGVVGTEGATEATQEFIGMLGEWSAKNLTELAKSGSFTPDDLKLFQDGDWDKLVDAAKSGASVAVLLGGAGEAAKAGQWALTRRGNAAHTQNEIQASIDATEALAGLAAKSPALASEFAQKVLPQHGTVRIDAGALASLAPGIVARLGLRVDDINDAMERRARLRVDVGRIAAIPDPEHRKEVYNLFQSESTGLTKTQADQDADAEDAEIDEEAAKVKALTSAMAVAKKAMRAQIVAAMTPDVKARLKGGNTSAEEVAADAVTQMVQQAKYLYGGHPAAITEYINRRSVAMSSDLLSGTAGEWKTDRTEQIPVHQILLSNEANASTIFHEMLHAFKADFDDVAKAAAETAKLTYDPAILAAPKDDKGRVRKRTDDEQTAFDEAKRIQDAKDLVHEHTMLMQQLPTDPVKAQETLARWGELFLREGIISKPTLADTMHRVRTYFTSAYNDAQQVYDSYKAQTGEELQQPSPEALEVLGNIVAGQRMAKQAVTPFVLSAEMARKLRLTDEQVQDLTQALADAEVEYASRATAAVRAEKAKHKAEARTKAEEMAADPAMAKIWYAQGAKAQGVADVDIMQTLGISQTVLDNALKHMGREKWTQAQANAMVTASFPKAERDELRAEVMEGWMSRFNSALSLALGKKNLNWSAMQSLARNSLRDTPIRDALDTKEHNRAMEYSTLAMRRTLTLGELGEAWGHLAQADIHRHRILEAKLIKADFDSFRDDLRGAMEAEGGKYHPTHHAALLKLGARMGVKMKGPPKIQVPTAPTINTLLSGILTFDQEISDGDAAFDMVEATVDQVYEMIGAGRALMHQGDRILTEQRKAEADRVTVLAKEAGNVALKTAGTSRRTDWLVGEWNRGIRTWMGGMANSVAGIRTFAHLIEGGNPTGSDPVTSAPAKMLWDLMHKADQVATLANEWATAMPIAEIRTELQTITDAIVAKQIHLPIKSAIYHARGEGDWTAQDVMTLVLQYGSPSGREAIAAAYGMKLTEAGTIAEVEQVLAHVNPSVFNTIWAQLRPVFDRVNETHEEVNGFKKPPIDTIAFGDFTGGYFPIHRDFSAQEVAEGKDKDGNGANDPTQFAWGQDVWGKAARQSMLKDRSGKSPFLMQTDVFKGLLSHLHWSAHYAMVEKDAHVAQQVLVQPDSPSAVGMTALFGKDGLATLRRVLNHVRHPEFKTGDQSYKWAENAMRNVVGSILARSLRGPVRTGVSNMTSLIKTVGPVLWFRGVKAIQDPAMKKLFLESPEARDAIHIFDKRALTLLKDLADDKRPGLRKAQESFMALWAGMDYATLGPAWAGTYQEALRQGKSVDGAKSEAGDRIRTFVPALGQEHSTYSLDANRATRAMAVFSSWMRKAWNRDRAVWEAFNTRKIGVGNLALHHAAHYWMPATTLAGAAALMSDDQEEPKTVVKTIVMDSAAPYIGWLPLVGSAGMAGIGAMIGASGQGASRMPGLDVPYAMLGKIMKAIDKGDYGEGTWITARAAGMVVGLPALELIEKTREAMAAYDKGGWDEVLVGRTK